MYKVAVLMATYNGAKYIEEQISSIFSQMGVEISYLLVNDDGSTDGTREILYSLQKQRGEVEVFQSAHIGPRAAFFKLLEISKGLDVDFVAFADQDDIWLPKKLYETVRLMDSKKSSLGISDVIITNFDSGIFKISEYSKKAFRINEVVIKNNAVGMTMVLRKKLVGKIELSMANLSKFVLHDWWVYASAVALGENVVYNNKPGVLYRQHPANVVGAKSKNPIQWIILQLANLEKRNGVRLNLVEQLSNNYGGKLPEQTAMFLNSLRGYTQMGIISKFKLMNKLKLRTDSKLQNLLLIPLILMNKF